MKHHGKKCVRVGSTKCYDYLVNQNIFKVGLFNENYMENDVKSMIFTILKSVETSYNKYIHRHDLNKYKSQLKMLNKLWLSLAKQYGIY